MLGVVAVSTQHRGNDNATEVFLMSSEIAKKCVAELIGTFWLTLGGCRRGMIVAA
jgi:hypothetical protein